MSFVRKMLSFLEIKDTPRISQQNEIPKIDSEPQFSFLQEESKENDKAENISSHCLESVLPMDLRFDNSNEIISKEIYSLYNGTLPKRRREIIARDILSTVGVCSSQSPLCREALKYLSENHSRIETCIYGAELCIPPKNNNELYLISSGYCFAGTSVRNKAIYWCEKYIENGAVSDYIQSHIIHTKNYSYDQRVKFVAMDYSKLGELYAEEKRYEDSNKMHQKAISIAPFLIHTYIRVAKNYISMHDFHKAIAILEEAKETIFYTIDESFKYGIDSNLINIEKQISKRNEYENVILPSILKIIADNPATLQKDLYAHFPDLEVAHLRWAFQFLEEEGKIIRNKKGSSYSLFINNK